MLEEEAWLVDLLINSEGLFEMQSFTCGITEGWRPTSSRIRLEYTAPPCSTFCTGKYMTEESAEQYEKGLPSVYS